MTGALNVPAVVRGGATALVLAVPAALLIAGSDDDDRGSLVYLAFLAVVVAYLLGGAIAGRRSPMGPFLNGAAAAAGAFVAVQAVSLVVRIIDGDGVSPLALVFNLLLAASIGIVGAGIATMRGTLGDGGGEPTG